jgi:hypothetical protein
MRPTLLALALVMLPFSAVAQSTSSADADPDRFQLDRRGDQIIRLDRRSGAISTCTETGSGLDCRASADERAALQDEIDRLAAEVDSLKDQLAGKPGRGTGLSKDGKELTLKLPSEEELKGVLGYLQEMARRVVEAVRSLAGEKG